MERFAGRFTLLRLLGRGGMGSVYLALDRPTRTECALKRLHSDVVHPEPDALRREFELLARIRHPAVVAVRELGFGPGGTPFYTMEYVPGIPSGRAVRRGDVETLSFVAAEVAHGLEALHAAGIVHGDLKPSNLLIIQGADPEGPPAGVRLVDFGLAALLGEGKGNRGTRHFTAPEVVKGEAPGFAADLYGFGATLFRLATGQPPHGASISVASAPSAALLEEAGIPEPMIQLILRLLAPSPAERPRDAAEVRRELERIHPAARRSLSQRLDTEIVVGRERELARLERWFALAPHPPTVTLLTGEAGSGKSALIGELAVRASVADPGDASDASRSPRHVVRLTCAAFESRGAVAAALIERLAADLDPAPARALTPAREALGRGESPAEAAWDSLTAGLQHGQRTLILLDDCERIDPLSRAFVRQLAFHPQAGGLRWVWASRSPGRELAEEDRMLVEARQAEHVHLGALDRATAMRLIETRLHGAAPDALGDFLWRRSGGHPGLLVETLRGAAASGSLVDGEVGLRVDAVSLERAPTPATFEEALIARLASLGPGPRAAAEALATFARPVARADALAIAAEARDGDLDRLVASGLAREDDHRRLTLQPPALADRILAEVAGERRQRLHEFALERPGLSQSERFVHLRHAGRAREALAAAAAANAEGTGDERLAIAAAELAESDAPDEAATWNERAGRALIDRGRHRAAIPYLERSLVNGPMGESRAARWSLMATALLRAGRPQDVERVTRKALAENPPEHLRAMLLVDEAARLGAIAELDRAREVASEALKAAQVGGEPVSIGASALTLGGVLQAQGRNQEAMELARKAEEAYSRAGHRMGRLRAIGLRAQAVATTDVAEADTLFEAAIRDAREPGLRMALDQLLTHRALLLFESGRWTEARDVYTDALRVASEEGRPRAAAVAVTNLAMLDAAFGMTRSAKRHAASAVRLSRSFLPSFQPAAWRALAQAYRIRGHDQPAENLARRSLSHAVGMGLRAEAMWSAIEVGRCEAKLGRWDRANEVWSGDPATSIQSVGDAVKACLSGRTAVRRNEVKEAQSRLAAIEAWLQAHNAPQVRAHALQLRAEIALARRDHEEAQKGIDQTVQVYESLPAPVDRAQAMLDFARLAIDLRLVGNLPVGEWLRTAASGFERVGDDRSRARALALIVENPQLSPTTRGVDPLRERDLIESVSRLLDSLSDVGELSQRAMRMAVEHLGAERGLLLLADAETGSLNPVVEHGPMDNATRDEALGYSRRAVERVTRSGGSLLVTDAPTDPDALSESVVHLGLKSIVCVPLNVAGRVIGAVYLDARRADAFNDADRGLLEGFAHLMAVAIEKSRSHEEVQRDNELLVDENLSLRREVGARFRPQNFIASSSPMQEILAIVERAAQTQSTVLITGENGTGKEEIARILHHNGRRAMGPFVEINCGAVVETLLESELFGILGNVATGVQAREGKFVQASGGTLFLDEIGDMPLNQQVALLSAIARREVTPVGGRKPIAVDVRIIAATNRDLRRLVEDGKFREDLYFRLNVIPIEMPPLRDRKADIPALAQHFVRYFAQQQERAVPEISRKLMSVLTQSDWPGNVRELRNYIERVVAMTPGRVLNPSHLPGDLQSRESGIRPGRGKRIADTLAEAEEHAIREALERSDGNQSKAARQLGMTEQSLRYRMRKYGIEQSRQSRRTRKKSR